MPSAIPRHIASLLAAFAAHSAFAATVNWTAATAGNWSDGANWSTAPFAPATSGDDIVFALGTGVATNIDSAWAVNSLTFQSTAGDYSLGGGPLSIGAGGIVSNKTSGTTTITAPLTIAANQVWSLNGNGSAGRLLASGNWSGSGNITKNGGSDLVLNGGSAANWSGSFTLERGTVTFNSGTSLARLGANAITVSNNGGNSTFFFNFNNNTNRTWANDFVFTDTGAGTYHFNAAANTLGTINLAGNLSSTSALGESIRFNNSFADATGTLLRYRIGGDNSGLTSAIVPTAAAALDGAVVIRNAFVSLDSANALGAGNGLHVSIGENDSAAAGRSSGLFTTAGHDVGAAIRVRRNSNTATPTTQSVYLGIDGAGQATFSGDIRLETSAAANHRAAHLRLKADAGGTATFSGVIFNHNDAEQTKTNDVWVEGAGTVVLSGANTYTAKTTVKAGATLIAANLSGSATGLGALEVESGATLGGGGSVAGAVVLLAGAGFSPGRDGAGVFTAGSSFTWNSDDSSGGFRFDLGATQAASDSLTVAGDFIKGSGNSFLFDFTGSAAPSFTYTLVSFGSNVGFTAADFSANIDGSFAFSGNTLVFTTAIPEPSAFAAFAGLAALGLASARRPRRRA